jgi:hypothetical protein
LEHAIDDPRLRMVLTAKDQGIQLRAATEVNEAPGEGLRGTVSSHSLQITSRSRDLLQIGGAQSFFVLGPSCNSPPADMTC